MSTPILATKLYVPRTRSDLVARPRLTGQLNAGLRGKLTLVSAPAGFGKTTLVGEWVHALEHIAPMAGPGVAAPSRNVAWLSLDQEDSDPVRFLTYVIAALQSIGDTVGQGALQLLQSPQPPPREVLLTNLLNDIATISDDFVLVLDDYYLVDAGSVDDALTFVLEHQPPQMHLVITTREDPQLPLARLRVQGQLTEIRAADLRFTSAEAAEFLNRVMGLPLSTEDVVALEARTEGWIAGLQLAAISLRGKSDIASFVQSFAGSHRFVLDYLVEEVLDQQPERLQRFLLQTAILDRLTGSLCDAVTGQSDGEQTLAHLERANLFVVALDDKRRWYRYHRLFADLLRQRLSQSKASMPEAEASGVATLHRRASLWYEAHSLAFEAFRHAVAAKDIERAAQLLEGGGTPLQYQGAANQVLNWLGSLPRPVLDARPALWVNYASALTIAGQLSTAVEEKLLAAEAALAAGKPDDRAEDLVGRIAAIRAMQAIPQNRADVVVAQARTALAHLNPDNLLARTTASWTLGYGYQLQGNRTAAREVYAATIPISQASGNLIITIGATVALGQIQEEENQLRAAETTYLRVLELTGDPPLPFACAGHFGLAKLAYEWNDLDTAETHVKRSLALGRQLPNIDTLVACKVLLARVQWAQGDLPAASTTLSEAEAFAREHNFAHRLPEVAALQVLIYLQRDDLATAARLAQAGALPLSKARVDLARGDPAAALHILGPLRRRLEAEKRWDKHLKVTILEAVALFASGDKDEALRTLREALALGEPEGVIRSFIDEGPPMVTLLSEARAQGLMLSYTGRLLAAAAAAAPLRDTGDTSVPTAAEQQPLVEPLSERELEVLRLVAEGLTNRQIAERLFIALTTVKGHNQRVYGKLQVRRRTEAVARARDLGLI
ncbi:MAG: LuxR family transcriptional regulator [Anaerolineae bacterium]|nr:LuxR family transcriptional regulator [Anaerolineae bacterium]